MSRTVGRLLAESLVAHGIDTIWMVPGESFLGLTDALTEVVPESAADTLNPVIDQIAGNSGTAGIALIIGVATAVSASLSCCGVVSSPMMEVRAIRAGNSASTP